MLNTHLKSLQNWLLPVSCVLCGAHTLRSHGLCTGCERSLPYVHHACPVCAGPSTHAEQACGRCQRRRPHFECARALLHYQRPVDRMIRHLKYSGQLHFAHHLGELMAARFVRGTRRPDCLVPVPLHPSRLRMRGYNQALEIARPVAKLLKIPLAVDTLRRIRPTPTQTGLPLEQRAGNVRGAFVARTRFDGKRVAIIDDVMTSGHTADSLSQCLRRAGAEAVEVWVVARA